jgi:hypothetical protein
LLLTLLLDNVDAEPNPNCWKIFHDLYIDDEAMNVIHNQAQKLMRLTETSADWRSSPYGEILAIANAETLHALRLIWAKYVTPLRSDSPVSKQFHTAIKHVFNKHYNNDAFTATVTRSFGALAMKAGDMTAGGIAVNHMQQFWKHGVVDPEDLPAERLCNPLFVYPPKSLVPPTQLCE